MELIPACKTAISALKIDQRVESDVKAGIPEVDRSRHTESEESLRSYVTREVIGRVHDERQSAMDEQLDLRSDIDIRQQSHRLNNTRGTIDQRVGARLAVLLKEMKTLARELLSARVDLEIFRNQNELTRDAVYKESRLQHYAIIFFIVICETVLNSYFLSKGSELGMLGGFFQSLVIALVNLGLAAFLAFSLRNSYHRSPMRKCAGLLLFCVVSVLAAAFVLGVGHYREAMEVNPFEASGLAVTRMLANPWGIQDFNAWIMVIVSAIAVILLTAKFFTVEDSYPGYADATRRVKDLQRRWLDESASMYDDIQSEIETVKKEASESEKAIRDQYIEFKASIERSDDIHHAYESDIVKAQELLNELIRHYQCYAARMMNHRPTYFGELLMVDPNKLPRLNTAGLEQHREDLASYRKIIEALDEDYKRAMEEADACGETYRQKIAEEVTRIEREVGLKGL